ncbi:MAG: P-loop NTPase [Firmicutes bacterium]|nr:P-loop NTPase [Bacillota bacterium]
MKIAITGKGGVGKTTLAAGLAQLFAQQGYQVYAVDADPDISLGTTLGVPQERLASQPPLIEMKQLIAERTGGGGLVYILNPQVDDVLDKYAIDLGRIKLLRMGAVKQAGTACYCPENAFLHAVVDSLLLGNHEVVILDMGAGIEHLTRGTARGVDLMLVVTEPTKVSVDTARVIQKLAGEMGVPKIKVIGNKVRSAREREFLYEHFREEEILGCLEFDEELWEKGMLEDPRGLREILLKSVTKVFDQILREVGEAAGASN